MSENLQPQNLNVEINKDPNLHKLDHLITYGWGRMKPYLGSAGQTTDKAETEELLKKQEITDVSFELCEGLNWS